MLSGRHLAGNMLCRFSQSRELQLSFHLLFFPLLPNSLFPVLSKLEFFTSPLWELL